MQGKQIEALLEGIVHAKTQRRPHGVDLTVDRIVEVAEPGQLDFGGGELEAAPTRPLEPEKRDPGDDHGWWTLDEGAYLLAYNEHLASDDDARLLLQPRAALVEQGLAHATLVVADELPRVALQVPPAGAQIKENARVSTLTGL